MQAFDHNSHYYFLHHFINSCSTKGNMFLSPMAAKENKSGLNIRWAMSCTIFAVTAFIRVIASSGDITWSYINTVLPNRVIRFITLSRLKAMLDLVSLRVRKISSLVTPQ